MQISHFEYIHFISSQQVPEKTQVHLVLTLIECDGKLVKNRTLDVADDIFQ